MTRVVVTEGAAMEVAQAGRRSVGFFGPRPRPKRPTATSPAASRINPRIPNSRLHTRDVVRCFGSIRRSESRDSWDWLIAEAPRLAPADAGLRPKLLDIQ